MKQRHRFLFTVLILIMVAFFEKFSGRAQTIPAWQANTAYTVGTLVTYNSIVYKCLQAHTSQIGWEPPNTPSLWELQSGTLPTSTNTTAPSTNTPLPPVTNTSIPATSAPTKTNTPSSGADGSPYGGTARAIPGTIEVEDFNTGGQGIAYNDTTAGNSGNAYRTTDNVDIEASGDSGGGFNVGWVAVGEWTKYTVNVQTAATYTIDFRVASTNSTGRFHLEVDGVNVTGTLAVPLTGAWQTYTTITKTGVNLSSGQHILRLYTEATGANYNWIKFSISSTPATNTPVSATNTSIPPITATNTKTNTAVPPTATKTSPPTSSTNIALGRPATASSVEAGSTLTANNAVDGNAATRWASVEAVDPQWIYVDLGTVYSITRVKLNWEAAYGKSYQIQVSNDTSSWFSIYTTTTGDGGIDDLTGLSGSGRYVRMNGTQRGTAWGYSLWEFEVYSGTPVATNTPTSMVPTNTPGGATSTPIPPSNTPINPSATSTQVTGGGGIKLILNSGWNLQSSARITQTGDVLSSASFQPSGWYPITVPATVIGGLLQNNVYSDPYYGKNFQLINANDFNVSWWYRKAFSLPASENGKRVWLKLEGLSYRANVWFNGTQIANSTNTVGQWRTFEFDVTSKVNYTGTNVLAVEVFRAVNPKTTDLGITFVDWNPNPPDWNMGILNDVVVSTSGAVIIRNPLVTTNFDLPSLSVAHLTVLAEVKNGTSSSVTGTLQGSIGSITFSQNVTLAANETKRVTFTNTAFPQLDISNPSIWWPWNYGTPNLNTLNLSFTVSGQLSDSLTTQFGIRQVSSTINSSGSRQFSINGKPILVRGGAWAPDIFQQRDPVRQEAEIRYVRDLNLNTIRYEGKMEDENMFNLTDKYGMLVMIGWNCCDSWQTSSSWSSATTGIANEMLKSLMYRLRNHPSMLAWLNGSDEPAAASVEQGYLNIESDLQWPNAILSSAAAASSSISGATGVKMNGPYDWVPPIYWETDSNQQGGGAWNFSTEISPGPAVPPLDSLVKFIPPDHLWPIDDVWNYHAGGGQFNNLNIFTNALNARYGTANSAADYALKAQIAAYESHKAMFEAYGRHKYTATGVVQWMMRNAWPSMIWHLYDHYLRPGGSYYGAKNALEPLHIQYAYNDKAVVVINSTLQSYSNLKATATVYNLDGSQKYTNSVTLGSLAADGVATAFILPSISGLSTTYFLRLSLTDSSNKVVSLQTYWLSTKADVLNWGGTTWYYTPTTSYADFTALSTLPQVNVTFTQQITNLGGQNDHTVTLTNNSSAIAFFVHIKITKGAGGEEVLPILWQDNYITLLPGETRQIKATYNVADLGGTSPTVVIDSWNNR